MILKNDNLLLVFGLFSLTIAILLGRYVSSTTFIDFLEGFFYGLSIVLNVGYLIRVNRNASKKS